MTYILRFKKFFFIGITLIIVASSFIFIFTYSNKNNNKSVVYEEKIKVNDIKKEEKNEVEEKKEEVSVDIKGEITNPGVYKIDSSKLVIDVINIAGGLKKYANTKCINLSKQVKNEMVIYIHSNTEVNKITQEIKSSPVTDIICPELKNDAYITKDNSTNIEENKISEKVNINTASKEELMDLSGIGESKALSIISYREQQGLFKTIEDIKNISGIGDSIFNKIKDLIIV